MAIPRASLHVLEVLGRGGMETMEAHALRVAAALQDGGARVSAVCPDDGMAVASLRALGCEVFVTAMGDNPSFASVRDVAMFVQSEDVSVVHAHYANAHVLGALVAAVTARPCLATLHGPGICMLDLEAHRLTRHAHLHAVCPQAVRHARAVGVSPGRLHLVANAPEDAESALRYRPDSPQVGILAPFAANAIPARDMRKPVDELDAALRRAWPRAAPVVLDARRTAEEAPLALAACVVSESFASTAPQAGAATAPHAGSASERQAPAPIAPRLLDVLAAGIPVVAPAAAASGLLQDGRNCVLAGGGGPADLARCLAALVADPDRAAALGAAGRRQGAGWPRPGMLAGLCALLQGLATAERGTTGGLGGGFANRPDPVRRASTPARSA